MAESREPLKSRQGGRERGQERRYQEDRPRRRNTSSASDDRRRRRSDSADGRSMSPPAQKRRRRSPTDSRSPPRRRERNSVSPRRTDRRRDRSQSEERRDHRPDRGSYKDAQTKDNGRDQRRRSRSRDADRRRDRKQSYSVSPPRDYRDRSLRRDGRSYDKRRDRHDSPPSSRRNRAPLPSQLDSFKDDGGVLTTRRNGRGNDNSNAVAAPTEKEKINLRPTGLLATEANTLSFGTQKITLKYHQPPEARKPDPKRAQWRLFIFKGTEAIDTIDLFEKSCWLVGREKAVADLWVQSPGVSGQHAVLQFRAVDDRGGKKAVKLYVLDLESSNGTVLNGEKIPDRRYVEVRGGDVLQFGGSGRDYVVMLPGAEEKMKD